MVKTLVEDLPGDLTAEAAHLVRLEVQLGPPRTIFSVSAREDSAVVAIQLPWNAVDNFSRPITCIQVNAFPFPCFHFQIVKDCLHHCMT